MVPQAQGNLLEIFEDVEEKNKKELDERLKHIVDSDLLVKCMEVVQELGECIFSEYAKRHHVLEKDDLKIDYSANNMVTRKVSVFYEDNKVFEAHECVSVYPGEHDDKTTVLTYPFRPFVDQEVHYSQFEILTDVPGKWEQVVEKYHQEISVSQND